MSAAPPQLPPGFEALEPFAAQWLNTGADDRARRRRESSETERAAFFEVAKEHVDRALSLLDGTPLTELDAAEERLLNLLLGFAHVALAVEMQAHLEPRHADMSRHLPITRASADLAPQTQRRPA